MLSALLFFYVNLSAFHGDGTVVWLTQEGQAVVQRVDHDESRIYSLEEPQATMAQVRARLDRLVAERIKVVDRPGIPDEVRMSLGFRDADWRLHKFSLWEKDLAKQQAELRGLRDVAQEIIALSAKRKPDRTEHVAPGKLTVVRPPGISAADLDAALR